MLNLTNRHGPHIAFDWNRQRCVDRVHYHAGTHLEPVMGQPVF